MDRKQLKQDLLDRLRSSRKKYGQDHYKTYRAIYNIVKEFPYYDGYVETWLTKNGWNLKENNK